MLIEIAGFLSGSMAIGAAWVLLLRYERWKTVRNAYGAAGVRRQGSGNALIWPSR